MVKGPTISDVARVAGVSAASVSRALRGDTTTTPEMRQRVLAAVAEIGYRPHRTRHRSPEMSWLPVLVTDIVAPFDLEVIAGIQEQAEVRDLLPMIIRLTHGSSQLERVLHQMRELPMAGIASMPMDLSPQEWIRHQETSRVPLVVLNTEINHPKIASILVDFESATAQATRHLLDLNHTRIAYLGDYDDRISSAELRGVKDALAQRGIVYPNAYYISIPHTPEGVSQGISRIMSLPIERRPTAIVAFDDDLAIHILNALRYYGLRIPADISVVGFDNIPMAAHTYPPLTTVDIPKRRIGRQMVTLLETLTKNTISGIGSTIIEGQLLVRGTSGPAPR